MEQQIVELLEEGRFQEALHELEGSRVYLTLKDEAFTCRAPKGFIRPDLQHAMARGRSGLVEALRTAARDGDRWGRTRLHLAAESGDSRELQRQLTNGAELDTRDRHRQTALFVAADRGQGPVVDLLLSRGADPNLADLDSRTPLYVAVAGGHRAVVERLIQAGAELDRGSFLGLTPLALATTRRCPNPQIRNVLLQAGAGMEDQSMYDEVERIFLGTVLRQLDSFSPALRRHSLRVSTAAAWSAGCMDWPSDLVVDLRLLGLLHDLGKARMEPELRDAHPDDLDPAEHRRHTLIGEKALRDSAELPSRWASFPDLVRCHHEAWDGTGYPDRLRGDDIPLGSRILCVIDRYERLLERSVSWEEAYEKLRRESGRRLQPEMVEAFRPMAEELAELHPMEGERTELQPVQERP
ncbi:MAG: ankyrin repeat domain-containing protein [Armatimonadetes bacterium]|nr:ankyrin repeat domain-containing protein [Armatimonadota bacterium]